MITRSSSTVGHPINVFAHLQPYRFHLMEDHCSCGADGCLLRIYGDRYYIAIFQIGDDYLVSRWMSKN
jgi:hypothetical protein